MLLRPVTQKSMYMEKNIAAHFKVQLERLGYSQSSILMLPKLVQDFLTVQQILDLQQVTPEIILEYHEYLQERPNKNKPGCLSESYVNHHIYALKLFFNWLESKGSILSNPISGLEFQKPSTKPREILDLEEVKKLYKVCENHYERAILSLYYGCGLRRTEGIKLDLKDVQFRAELLYVRLGKGAKRRVVPMSQQVKKDLQNYAYNYRNAEPKEKAFLVGFTQKRINCSAVARSLKVLIDRAGIHKNITLHCLRHSIATHLLEAGLSMEDVRDFLGHRHLESTQIYTRISSKQLEKL